MSTIKQACLILLITVLIVTTVPLWGRVPIHPCLNTQPYGNPHSWQWNFVVMPENGLRPLRPLCFDLGAHTLML